MLKKIVDTLLNVFMKKMSKMFFSDDFDEQNIWTEEDILEDLIYPQKSI
jgi:hypothetical protein